MLDEASSVPIIAHALARLGVVEAERSKFTSRIVNVSIMACFRPPSAGKRVSPKRIIGALERVEAGLRDVAAGLTIIDGARATTGLNAGKRAESLALVQRATLGAIAEAILSRIQNCPVTDHQVADSMPEYGYLAFRNSWEGVFADASLRVAAIRKAFGHDDFRSPTRDREEWFVRAVSQLAEIYHDATGKEATAYSPGGDTTNRAWRPPFAQFIVDLWPTLGVGQDRIPSNRKIADAGAGASKLPFLGSME